MVSTSLGDAVGSPARITRSTRDASRTPPRPIVLWPALARSTVAVMVEPQSARVSHERIALASLQHALEGIDGIEVFSGQGGSNRFGVSGWELTLGQQFQFGDLRVETPATTLVVEVESGGGIGNLAKYWPLLAAGAIAKRLVIIHVFQIASAGDYIAHRRLWGFLVERMREDLERRRIRYSDAWEAHIFTYRRGEEAVEAAKLLRATVSAAGQYERDGT